MRFFSPLEIAEMLGVTPKTARNWIADGALPAHRFGRLLRVSEADLQAFLEARQAVSRVRGHAFESPVPESDRDTGEST